MLSAQSLREYYINMRRLDRRPNAVEALRADVARLDALVPDSLRSDRLAEAWRLEDRYRLSFWDALLAASAIEAGCTLFLSEDMNGGQKIDAMTIVNPFATPPESVFGVR